MTTISRGLLYVACFGFLGCTFDGGNQLQGSTPIDSGTALPDSSSVDSGAWDAAILDAGPNSDGSLADAMVVPDAMIVPDATSCGFIITEICDSGPPLSEITISGVELFNTDTDVRCRDFTQNDGTASCLVYTDTFTVQSGGYLRVKGSRILLVASASDVVIDGIIDVSSKRAASGNPESLGAGSAAAVCPSAVAAQNDVGGAGGGSGGSFQGSGGGGGIGDTNDSGGNDGEATGSEAAMTIIPLGVRAGCRGSVGGSEGGGPGAGHGGGGGAGGGAVGLLSIENFSQGSDGRILVSGAGASGGGGQAGGGGGGSGGMIYIEAVNVVIDGWVVSEGGGGGGGGIDGTGGQGNGNGEPGENATLNQDGTGGAGGSQFFPGFGTFSGGDGGTGAIIGQPNGQIGANSPAGAGGGGGGAGYIVVVGNLQFNGLQSPVIVTP